MASNRFRRVLPQLDPTIHEFVPQDFVPDLTGLQKVQTKLQAAYDASAVIPTPKHLQQDVENVKSMYLDPIRSMRDDAVSMFTEGKLTDGVRALRDMQTKIFELKQPGGVYDQFEQNYNRYTNYVSQLDKMYEKGDIRGDKKEGLSSLSLNNFKGSFDEDGNYRQFSGVTAVKDQDLAKIADELGDGWMADQVRSGNYTVLNGQYFDMRTKKFVDPKEVYQSVFNQLIANPDVTSYLQQEGLLKGYKPEQLEGLIKNAAGFAASKYGYQVEESDFLKNWALEQSKDQGFQMHLMNLGTGTQETSVFTINTGATPLDVDKDGRVKIGGEEGKIMTSHMGITGVSPSTAKYDAVKMEDYAKQNAKQHPYLERVVAANPRLRGKEGDPNWVESNEEYNKRIGNAYNDMIEKTATQYAQYQGYNADAAKKASERVFGRGGAPGELAHKAVYVMRPGKAPELITPEQLMKNVGAKDWEELQKRSNVLGHIDADNPFHPSGFEAVVGDGRRAVKIVVANTSVEEGNYNKPVYQLLAPKYDMKLPETGPVVYWPSGADPMVIKSVATPRFNEDGVFLGTDLTFYEAEGLDENGNPTNWVESPITEQELISAHNLSNPMTPFQLDKTIGGSAPRVKVKTDE